MTDDRMALVDLLQKSGDGDFLRSVTEAVLEILMEADVERFIGAGRHERGGDPSRVGTFTRFSQTAFTPVRLPTRVSFSRASTRR